MEKNKEPAPTKHEIGHRGYVYLTSLDKVGKGDYILDYDLTLSNKNAVIHCDSDAFVELINKHYEDHKSFVGRKSAKIIASDDPALRAAGIPLHVKIKTYDKTDPENTNTN